MWTDFQNQTSNCRISYLIKSLMCNLDMHRSKWGKIMNVVKFGKNFKKKNQKKISKKNFQSFVKFSYDGRFWTKKKGLLAKSSN